jgi:hypothetical protein
MFFVYSALIDDLRQSVETLLFSVLYKILSPSP